jgi:hypothetical protein
MFGMAALRQKQQSPRESATSPLFAGHYPSSKVVTPNTRSSRNGRITPVYIRAVSNSATSPRSCANATASRLMLGTSRNISPPPTLQSRQDHLGGGAVVGHQRTDLAALAAWTDHAPADKPAIAHKRATDMPGRADPGAQERGARSRKHRRVVCLYSRQWDFGQRDDASLRCIRGRDGAAVTDIGVSELRYHAIEPDHAWPGVRNGRIPYAQSITAAAQVLSHDVEAEEGEARAVIDARRSRPERRRTRRSRSLPDRPRRSRRRRRGPGSSLRLRSSSPLSRFRPAASSGCLDRSWRAIVQMD